MHTWIRSTSACNIANFLTESVPEVSPFVRFQYHSLTTTLLKLKVKITTPPETFFLELDTSDMANWRVRLNDNDINREVRKWVDPLLRELIGRRRFDLYAQLLICDALNTNELFIEMLSELPEAMSVYTIDFKPVETKKLGRYIIACHRVGVRKKVPMRHVTEGIFRDDYPKFSTNWLSDSSKPQPATPEFEELVFKVLQSWALEIVTKHYNNAI